jgi:serine/threonine protein kinase/uncharacterized protein YecT (DUF1311 family)
MGGLTANYEILRELGRGGMAVVYLARHRKSSRLVAIKTIRKQFVEDHEAMSRFAREARMVAGLDHPNLVRVYQVEQLGERTIALVMQYVPGGTLRDAMRESGPFAYDRATAILRDVGGGLGYAHAHGVVHRDVKPENIFLDPNTNRALLSDFGVARPLETETLLTMAGVTLGTPAYMSPEQIEGQQVDERSDIYSLGLVGWEMLAGKRPWDGDTLYSVIYKQRHEELPRLTELRPGIPAPLLYAIEGALQKHRDERWASVGEFLAQLLDGAPDLSHVRVTVGSARTSDGIAAGRAAAGRPDARAGGPPGTPTRPANAQRRTRPDEPTVRLRRPVGQALPATRPAPYVGAEVPAEPSVHAVGANTASDETGPGSVSAELPVRDGPAAVPAAPATPAASATAAPEEPELHASAPGRSPATSQTPRLTRRRALTLLVSLALAAAVALLVARRELPTVLAARSVPRDTLARTASGGAVVPRRDTAGSAASGASRDTTDLANRRAPDSAARGATPAGDTTRPRRTDSTAARPAAPAATVALDSAGGTTTAPPRTHADSLARCDSPSTPDQRACLYAHVAESDTGLNRVYGALIAGLRTQAGVDDSAGDPPAVRRLRTEQRAWLAERDAECRRRTEADEKTLWAPVRARCLGELSAARASELSTRLKALEGARQ